MKRFLAGSLLALVLAACSTPRNDTTTGGTGSESGTMSGDTMSSMDTAMSGGAGTRADTGRAGMDTTAR